MQTELTQRTENDWVSITPHSLDPAAAIAFVTTPGSGGINIFLGITRAQTDPQKGPLLALDYDAYPEMALKQMTDMVAHARTLWPISRCVLHHRTGEVPVAQPSVLIAISTPHRAESFGASRHLIDMLKSTATIWKKDIYAGQSEWHHDPTKTKG